MKTINQMKIALIMKIRAENASEHLLYYTEKWRTIITMK